MLARLRSGKAGPWYLLSNGLLSVRAEEDAVNGVAVPFSSPVLDVQLSVQGQHGH